MWRQEAAAGEGGLTKAVKQEVILTERDARGRVVTVHVTLQVTHASITPRPRLVTTGIWLAIGSVECLLQAII
jgi:hypothetical protein